ncbi:MAG: hypothetical protein WDA08_02110 [Weeksellaceae bacterium]|jgi:hypothetical protein
MKMNISKKIIDRILNDNDFSMELAMRMGIQQQSVMGLARRNSVKLTLYEAVLYYRRCGYDDKDIFSLEGVETKNSENENERIL